MAQLIKMLFQLLIMALRLLAMLIVLDEPCFYIPIILK